LLGARERRTVESFLPSKSRTIHQAFYEHRDERDYCH
jgi:hypothetical protein